MNKVLMSAFMLGAALCCSVLCAAGDASAQVNEGEQLFNQVCVACHTINKGKLIGPDLANVHQRRPEEWIIRFVKSSQSVIKSGDAYAAALFEEFNKIPMPDNNFTDAQILNIISYIAANSPGGTTDPGVAVADPVRPRPDATETDIRSGRLLFGGQRRFENGGPACNSCHNLRYAGIMAGGALSKDLTDVHTRLGVAGVEALVANAPFPVMKEAFKGRELTEKEIFEVASFLEHVAGNTAAQRDRFYGVYLFLAGGGGAIVLMGLFGTLWIRVKRTSVNKDIYDRQVKSTWEPMNYSDRIG